MCYVNVDFVVALVLYCGNSARFAGREDKRKIIKKINKELILNMTDSLMMVTIT